MSHKRAREARYARHLRIRAKVRGTADQPRLCVFRSLKNIYAQIIDDLQGHTLAAASSIDPETRGETIDKNKTEQAKVVGSLLAKRASSAGIKSVIFDRGGYKYHGRVKSLAEAARQGGLRF
jgi:large subunit ribosomal protein L18